jgi:stage II sporulation protein P
MFYGLEAEMRKHQQYLVQRKLKLVVWSLILLASVYLLIRFAVISFSEDMGQASGNAEETYSYGRMNLPIRLVSGLSIRIMKTGSGLLSYAAQDKASYDFPINLVKDTFVISYFTGDASAKKALAKEVSNPLLQTPYMETGEQSANGGNGMGSSNGIEEQKDGIGFHNITNGILTKEYILTNGSLNQEEGAYGINDELKIDILEGDINGKDITDAGQNYDGLTVETFVANDGTMFTLNQLKDLNFLVRHFYIVDGTTKVTEPLFDAGTFLEKDMKLAQTNEKPQILVYHTHGSEAFIDSRQDVEADTIVGVGDELVKILKEKYGYNVIHDKTAYDTISDKDGRNLAYNYAKKALEETLNTYPSIEVMIDLHRNSGKALTTMIDGKETAQIMLFNGLSRDQNGPLPNHDNPYLQDNLAFGFQLQLKSLDLYPNLFVRNYLKCYRYNLHFRPKSILVELGTVNNTVKSAKNAMEPFAEVLHEVLEGK